MKSRLEELRRAQAEAGVEMNQVAVDIPQERSNLTGQSAPAAFMADFFQEVDQVKEGITAIKAASKRIQAITEERVFAVSTSQEQALSDELAPLVDSTNRAVQRTKALLVQMAEATRAAKATTQASEGRIRDNLTCTLQRKFVDVSKEYQLAQTKHKAAIQRTVKRQLEIVKPDVTPDEIDQVLRSGGTEAVFKSAILKGAADPIKSAFADVADKYQDVLRLEQSVAELHQMFVDFALLTEQQGELIDQIEYQVKSASEYIEDGNTDIEYAIKYQSDIRKRYCCIIVIVLVVIVVLLAAVGAFGKP